MPKVATSRSPYRLSLPSPTGLPLRSTFYLRSIPSTPSPTSKHASCGLLNDFAGRRGPTLKREETGLRVPNLLSPFEMRTRPSVKEDVNEIGLVKGPEAVAPEDSTVDTADMEVVVHEANPEAQPELLALHPSFPRRGSRIRRAPLRLRENLPPNPIRAPRRRTRAARDRRASEAASTRQQLLRAQTEIEELQAQVERMDRSERRLKKRVSEGQELVKDIRVEVEEARAEALRAEGKADEMAAGMEALRRDFNQYRGWWLTENRSLKLVLHDVPKPFYEVLSDELQQLATQMPLKLEAIQTIQWLGTWSHDRGSTVGECHKNSNLFSSGSHPGRSLVATLFNEVGRGEFRRFRVLLLRHHGDHGIATFKHSLMNVTMINEARCCRSLLNRWYRDRDPGKKLVVGVLKRTAAMPQARPVLLVYLLRQTFSSTGGSIRLDCSMEIPHVRERDIVRLQASCSSSPRVWCCVAVMDSPLASLETSDLLTMIRTTRFRSRNRWSNPIDSVSRELLQGCPTPAKRSDREWILFGWLKYTMPVSAGRESFLGVVNISLFHAVTGMAFKCQWLLGRGRFGYELSVAYPPLGRQPSQSRDSHDMGKPSGPYTFGVVLTSSVDSAVNSTSNELETGLAALSLEGSSQEGATECSLGSGKTPTEPTADHMELDSGGEELNGLLPVRPLSLPERCDIPSTELLGSPMKQSSPNKIPIQRRRGSSSIRAQALDQEGKRIASLHRRILALENRERCLKMELRIAKRAITGISEEAAEARKLLTVEKLECGYRKREACDRASRYCRWWLIESQALKDLLEFVAEPYHPSVERIMSSSRQRFSDHHNRHSMI
ncbi:hypothetical protein FA13DRAFT_1710451 [Coprinellus micaceus]|uniref:Uncharacterized protein n=1 Tax=Coprinellus micaceus TaxID=71717 RepID=A0A4Y7TA56_COPMI|nr:hypothetical protein FA13DRAFT_1710451 [Coprinellus micaceus]